MSTIQEYEAIKHPDSDLDYGRRWGDITHVNKTILKTTVRGPDGTVTETETIVEDIVVDVKGWLRENETIIESDWVITSDKEKIPTLKESSGGTGIGQLGQVTSIFLKGGTPSVYYTLTNNIKAYDSSNGVFRYESMSGIIKCCRT